MALRRMAKMSLIAATAIAALAMLAGVFVISGIYNIGADDHHTQIVLTLIAQLRERSIDARARALEVPRLDDPARIVAGAQNYAAHCVVCHLAPGVGRSDLRVGLYPHPPNLAQEDIHDAKKAFWTVKHGIKMSAMPAWGKSLDDATIWDIVSFLDAMPAMSPEIYRQLSQGHSG
jgi:mono/diheme cytochrome c family protein